MPYDGCAERDLCDALDGSVRAYKVIENLTASSFDVFDSLHVT